MASNPFLHLYFYSSEDGVQRNASKVVISQINGNICCQVNISRLLTLINILSSPISFPSFTIPSVLVKSLQQYQVPVQQHPSLSMCKNVSFLVTDNQLLKNSKVKVTFFMNFHYKLLYLVV